MNSQSSAMMVASCHVCLFGERKPPAVSKSDYYVHIKRMSAPFRFKWEWRILRRSKDIDVGIYGAGFSTPEGARRSGKVALEKFLSDPPLVPSNEPTATADD